jgi:predicted house-cleaning noncanonical NTP pyrophosphatase (MazG superfamily)
MPRKLVRNRIPKIIEKNEGTKPVVEFLNEGQFKIALLEKLVEEAKEARKARTPEKTLAELADLQEVIEEAVKFFGFSHADLKRIQKRKRRERGGFSKRIAITF